MSDHVLLSQCRARMGALGLTIQEVADYLGYAPSTVWRKLQGQAPLHYADAEALKRLLGIDAPPRDPLSDDPGLVHLLALLQALPPQDRRRMYTVVAALVTGCQSHLKPEGWEALRALEALGA